jgi:hypothetical protein
LRLFTFGCSFTSFIWPTWADIIAMDLDLEFYNYGYSGLGNQGIQARIVEADFKHNITKDDIMLIFWSTWAREDRFIDDVWRTGGSVFSNQFYDDDFVKKYWSWENDIVKNSTAIHMTTKAYKDIIKYQGSMTAFPSISHSKDILVYKIVNKLFNFDDPHTKFYRDNLEMPPVWNLSKHVNSQFNGNCSDTHPDVKHHMTYVEENVYPKLGYKLKDSTRELFNTIHDDLASVFDPKDDVYTLGKKAHVVLSKYNIKKSST